MAIKRLYDTLVGATVAWNQLCNSSSVTVPNGHKYYMIKGGTASIGASTGTAITGLTSGTDIVIDLTQMFGSTLADYIYNLESATAGAGVAKLKEWGFFTEEYIPYNPGSLESVEATAHVMRDADENIIGNYNLGTDTLRGLFKLDSNNNLYADGDTKTSNGTVTRKYDTTIINGESDITAGTSGMPFKVRIEGKKRLTAATDSPNGVSDKLAGVTQASTWGVPYTFSFTNNTDYIFFKLADSITTIEDAKTWLASNPITIVYELATPTTEQSTPFTNPQICDPDGTEEYVTSNGVPVGHETRYQL